jgi:hypothetical protein
MLVHAGQRARPTATHGTLASKNGAATAPQKGLAQALHWPAHLIWNQSRMMDVMSMAGPVTSWLAKG